MILGLEIRLGKVQTYKSHYQFILFLYTCVFFSTSLLLNPKTCVPFCSSSPPPSFRVCHRFPTIVCGFGVLMEGSRNFEDRRRSDYGRSSSTHQGFANSISCSFPSLQNTNDDFDNDHVGAPLRPLRAPTSIRWKINQCFMFQSLTLKVLFFLLHVRWFKVSLIFGIQVSDFGVGGGGCV